MKTPLTIRIYASVAELPEQWNSFAIENSFLGIEYLKVLEISAPSNMNCHFIGLFDHDELVGISLAQHIDLNPLTSFGQRDQCLKNSIRNSMLKKYCSHILIIGNNMLSGQNTCSFSDKIEGKERFEALKSASKCLKKIFKKKGIKVQLTIFKDFEAKELIELKNAGFDSYFQFSAQPNMVFNIPIHWNSEQDYLQSLSKKYRDQYKRARKKSAGIEKRKLELDAIIKYENTIYDLYLHVAKNAHFNTFFLAKNHFSVFKEILKDHFLFYGYFLDDKLIGFNTIIKNGEAIDTYFLGYDENIQREKMLYLNMLYDMVAYSTNQGYKKIIFARTALEIKSSIGAKPQKLYSFAKHNHPIAHFILKKTYRFLEPQAEWKERNPFR